MTFGLALPDHELLETLGTDAPPLNGNDDSFVLVRGRLASGGASVLLKIPRAAPAPSSAAAALRREASNAARIAGSATLQPRCIETAANPVLMMQDPGGELLSTLIRRGPLAIDLVLSVGVQLATGLASLHAQGWLHLGLGSQVVLCDAASAKAWLIDFAAAQPVSGPFTTPTTAARLRYVAPEQTGRLDAAPDARSDLYVLGLVLYEMLVGRLPTNSDDALALMHWHIAGSADAPARVRAEVPAVLSQIVMKLLAKAPDERYQSANGLAEDLAVCAREWAVLRRIPSFALGRRDVGAHMQVSTRLYGREAEVATLLQAFERSCAPAVPAAGRGSMLLVQGYAGIGKTALIQQLYRPIVRHKGNFTAGKFDQVNRGEPLGALIQAFRGLVRQLLGQSEAALTYWRGVLLEGLGSQGGVLVEVVPEIEIIVGKLPEAAQLAGVEALNRFQRVVHNFIAAVARPEHPLVLFIDDLQWADAATLALLEHLLVHGEIRGLMLMGAYRDNEIDGAPRLARLLDALAAAEVNLVRLDLGPLGLPELTRWLAASLRSDASHAEPLAALVHAKTGGNPFFVVQFLKMLERDGHFHFDDAQACWAYRLEAIVDAPLADNVIDLMTRACLRLSARAQYTLSLAACIGHRFGAQTLAIVCEQSLSTTREDLDQVLALGLVVYTTQAGPTVHAPELEVQETSFAFLHDRVQQAAYGLIPAERRRMVHLTVGRLLRQRAPLQEQGERLFDIVQHLNLGAALIPTREERLDVAALNLEAGRRAKSATAHAGALELFLAGCVLLDETAWRADYTLVFDLHLEAAECQYLSGDFEAAQTLFTTLREHARSGFDQARVLRLRSVQLENMARYDQALDATREGLALIGMNLPQTEADKLAALDTQIARVDELRAGRAIASLIELPVMRDPQLRLVMSMLTDIWSAAFILGDPTLARWLSATLVCLSLEHGNVEESAYGYVTHAITVGPIRGDYALAHEFGRLALSVNQRFNDVRHRAKIYQQFHAHVNLWCEPFQSCVPYAREAARSGLDSGDFLYAAYGAGTEPWAAFAATQSLAQFVRDYEPSVAQIERLKNAGFADAVRLQLNWARTLMGAATPEVSLSHATLREEDFVQRYRDNPFFSAIHGVLRLHLCCLLGDPTQALQAARHAAPLAAQLQGTIWPVLCDFWHGLALAANHGQARAAEQALWLAQLRRMRDAFSALAQHCRENWACPAWLLGAEIEQLEGREVPARALYEQAIEYATRAELWQYLAQAHELCGAFHGRAGRLGLAALHLGEARQRHAQWGAAAKAEAMQRQYGAWLPTTAAERAHAARNVAGEPVALPVADGADGLDLFSVLKAAQAIATEVELDKLLPRLLHIAIESAGAERACLVLEGEAAATAYAAVPHGAAFAGVPLEHCTDVPIGLVNYVRRSCEAVVLTWAALDELHGGDPYIVQHRPRSLAVLPVLLQGRLIAVLVLEHRHVAGAFTAPRVRVLQSLSTQAAIALENARLFAAMRQEIREREQAQAQLGAALAQVRQLSAELEAENSALRRDLMANVSHDLRTPLAALRGYLELLASKGEALQAGQRQEYLDTALRQAGNMALLIDELFELAKLEFKGLALHREHFPLPELAHDVVRKFQLSAAAKQVQLGIEAPADLPLVWADLGLIERVLDNLIGNALQHTPAGGRVGLRLQHDAQAAGVRVKVADSGAGISAQDLPHVFDRHYRGCGARRGGGAGAGLGLAITRRILDLHGCTIDLASSPGHGSCFAFTLPAQNRPS